MGAAAPFDPATLFGANDRGAVFDLGDSANLRQLSGGTGAVSAINDPIGWLDDLGPMARNATQATAANRLLYRGAPRSLGSELLTNGRIVDDTGFTLGAGWARSGATVVKTAGSASDLSWTPSPALEAGALYQLSYTMTRSAGTLTPGFTGGTSVSTTARSAGGSYTETIMAVTGNTTFRFAADAAFAGSIKSVTLKKVTSHVCPGGYMFGSPQRLVTPAIDMSNSDKLTVIYSVLYDQAIASTTCIAFGNWSSQAGSVWCGYGTNPVGRLRGDTGAGSITLNAPDTLVGAGGAAYVDMHEFDLSQAALADEISVTTVGVKRSGTASGTAAGSGNFGNYTLDLGVASLRGTIRKVFAINRLLTPTEKASALAWAKRGSAFGAVLGDSTIAGLYGAIPIRSRASSFCGGLVTGRYELAEAGRKIADMLSFWNALPEHNTLDCVIVQIGLNDVKGRVGENLATAAIVIADYQALINKIVADVSPSCRVYVAQMTPCKGWLDTATNPTAAYSAWLALNDAIAGNGATPITGVHRRITSHVAQLSDGNGYLQSIYDYNDDHVHESNEGAWLIAQAWRGDALEPDGLLDPA